MFDLALHGPDTYVGVGPRYPWGGLYGGQIVAQALRAASATVDEDKVVHSLRAYYIRRGDHTEPVRYEVDRIRNGRSFATRIDRRHECRVWSNRVRSVACPSSAASCSSSCGGT